MGKRIPDGYRAVTPSLTVKGAAQAIDVYTRALGHPQVERLTGPERDARRDQDRRLPRNDFATVLRRSAYPGAES
jgi:uncharacterized glyoxalase superfamily protein PhnB